MDQTKEQPISELEQENRGLEQGVRSLQDLLGVLDHTPKEQIPETLEKTFK